MGKNVYSLVLSNKVIEKIDEAAYNLGTSRSNLINQVLAEYVSYTTPEKQIENIFQTVEKMFEKVGNFQIIENPSPYLMNIKSLLRYKYRPNITYKVELYDNLEYSFGKMKVTLRTTNKQLIEDLNSFYRFFAKLEEKYIKKILGDNLCYKIEKEEYERQFILPRKYDDLGILIGDFIQIFDELLKIYLSYLPYKEKSEKETEQAYLKLFNNVKAII